MRENVGDTDPARAFREFKRNRRLKMVDKTDFKVNYIKENIGFWLSIGAKDRVERKGGSNV